MPLLATALLGGLLVLASAASEAAVAAAACGVAVLVAAGLAPPGRSHERVLGGSLIALSGVAAALLTWRIEPDPETGPTLAPLLWVLGPAVVLALFVGLARRSVAIRPVEWLAQVCSGVVLATFVAALPAVAQLPTTGSSIAVIVAGAAVTGAAVGAPLVPRRPWLSLLVAALVVGSAGAAVVAVELDGLRLPERAAVATGAVLAAGIGAAAAHTVLQERSAGWLHRCALVPSAALALSAPVAAVLARVVLS